MACSIRVRGFLHFMQNWPSVANNLLRILQYYN